MSEPTAEEIEEAVARDAEAGVKSFSDGTNSVNLESLKDRLDVAERKRRADVAANNSSFGLRTTRLLSPGGWE